MLLRYQIKFPEKLLFKNTPEAVPGSGVPSEIRAENIRTPEELQQAIVDLDKRLDTTEEALQEETFDIRSHLTQLTDRLVTLREEYSGNREAIQLIEEAENMIKDLQGDLDDVSGDFSINHYVGYHQTGVLTPEKGTVIETAGLKPCVGVLLVGNRKSDGKRVACILHFSPQFLNRESNEEQEQHLTITKELLQEGLDSMVGVELASIQAVLSGHSDFRGKEWDDMTVAERNAHNVVNVLTEAGITNLEQYYAPEFNYRSLHYNIDTCSYFILEDPEDKKVPHGELQIYQEGSLGEDLARGSEEEKPRETTEKDLKSFSVEIKGVLHRELYRAFDAFRNAKTERQREARFNRLVRLVKNHVESPDLDRVDAGFQMAYSIYSFLNINGSPDNTGLYGRALTLFRDSELAIYERFKNRPEDVLSYIHQVKSSLKDIGQLDEDLDRQKDWWIQELNRHLDHGVLEKKFEIIESPQRVQLALEVDDERWTINYKFSSGPYVFLIIQSEKDSKLKRYVYLENFEEMIRRGEIDGYIRRIKEERESEDKSRKTLKDYDLPHGKENTLYQMFIPEIYDPIVGSALLSMVAMRALLESKFGILVPEIRFLGHGASESLIAFVEQAKTDGYNTVHLDIAQHGSEEGFENFGKPDLLDGRVVDEHLTNPYDLLASLEEVDSIEINLSTIACHGARLVPAYEEYRKNHTDTLSNINIFTQTKPDVVNLVASLNREDSEFSWREESASSTYYIIFVMEGLSNGMTYGQAVDYADQQSQEVSGLNPESVVHGEVIR